MQLFLNNNLVNKEDIEEIRITKRKEIATMAPGYKFIPGYKYRIVLNNFKEKYNWLLDLELPERSNEVLFPPYNLQCICLNTNIEIQRIGKIEKTVVLLGISKEV